MGEGLQPGTGRFIYYNRPSESMFIISSVEISSGNNHGARWAFNDVSLTGNTCITVSELIVILYWTAKLFAVGVRDLETLKSR